MGFLTCSAKLMLFILNFTVLACGIAIIVAGAVANNNGTYLNDLMDGQISGSSIAILVIGAILFITAFLGCCGALRDSPCMLSTYGSILIIIVILEVTVAVYAFYYKSKFDDTFDDTVQKLFDDYKKDKSVTSTVDDIQRALHCCGTTGPLYWSLPLPKSCFSDSGVPYIDGCSKKLLNLAHEMLQLVGVSAIVVAVIEVLAIFFSFCVSSSIRKGSQRSYA